MHARGMVHLESDIPPSVEEEEVRKSRGYEELCRYQLFYLTILSIYLSIYLPTYIVLYYCSISIIYSYEIREIQEYSNCSDQDSDWISLPVRFSFRSALVGYGDLSCVK